MFSWLNPCGQPLWNVSVVSFALRYGRWCLYITLRRGWLEPGVVERFGRSKSDDEAPCFWMFHCDKARAPASWIQVDTGNQAYKGSYFVDGILQGEAP